MNEENSENVDIHLQENQHEGVDESIETAPEEIHIEERPNWGEFEGGELDEQGEFKEPTPEEQERFDARMERVSEVFEDADFDWYLDGATNISLYKDEMIRNHKDIDISVFGEDVEKFNSLLTEQGFAIFKNFKEGEVEFLRKVSPEDLRDGEKLDLSICKLDEDGKIDKNSQDKFNLVDLHLHSRDEEGNTVISYTGTTLDKEYFEPVKKEMPNGKTVNLSHPAVTAYHKLHSERPYDEKDLELLRPELEEKDISMLKSKLEEEIIRMEEMAREILKDLYQHIASYGHEAENADEISQRMWSHPEVIKRSGDEKMKDYVETISEHVFNNQDITEEEFIETSLDLVHPTKELKEKITKLG